MGSFTSKTFEDMMEVPVTPVSGKRVLDFDPRSPSVGISRTPIQVEKTPERLVDPRSPTSGIPRTPILNGAEDGSQGSIMSSSERQRHHSYSEGSPVKYEPLTLEDSLACLPPLDLDLDDVSEEKDSIQLLKRANSEPDLTAEAPVQIPRAVSKTPGKNVRQRKAKGALFPSGGIDVYVDSNARSPLRTLPDSHTRSPLSKRNFDVNSPLSIVQRKQVNKLGLLKNPKNSTPLGSPCRFESMTPEDKENISM